MNEIGSKVETTLLFTISYKLADYFRGEFDGWTLLKYACVSTVGVVMLSYLMQKRGFMEATPSSTSYTILKLVYRILITALIKLLLESITSPSTQSKGLALTSTTWNLDAGKGVVRVVPRSSSGEQVVLSASSPTPFWDFLGSFVPVEAFPDVDNLLAGAMVLVTAVSAYRVLYQIGAGVSQSAMLKGQPDAIVSEAQGTEQEFGKIISSVQYSFADSVDAVLGKDARVRNQIGRAHV